MPDDKADDKRGERVKEPKDGSKRDYSQRAHDVVREVEKRHADDGDDE